MHALKMICAPQHLEEGAALSLKERVSKAKQFHHLSNLTQLVVGK